jgi:hypothetical protein
MEAQDIKTLLDTISGHIGDKSGTVIKIIIRGRSARVLIDWETFKTFFGGDTDATRTGNEWSKAYGNITYLAIQDPEINQTVPT